MLEYIMLDSLRRRQYKINLIFNLAHRALVICLPRYLASEIGMLKICPGRMATPYYVNRCTEGKPSFLSPEKVFGPKKRPMYVRPPYKGESSNRFEGHIRRTVNRCHH